MYLNIVKFLDSSRGVGINLVRKYEFEYKKQKIELKHLTLVKKYDFKYLFMRQKVLIRYGILTVLTQP
jgi:hypothetical protein